MKKTELKLQGTDNFFIREAYKVLRSNIQFCGQEVRVVAITSCHENEGKTVISLSLGKSFAELDKKVLVVDADMRKSVIVGRNTTSKDVKGLSELLTGLANYEDCIYKTQYPMLDLIFSGKYPPNPVELLSSEHFENFLAEVREKYDYVIIDLPPLGAVIDAAIVAPMCDGVALVVSDDNVRYSMAQEVVDQLRTSKSKILGVIRNDTNKKKSGYYYRRGYGGYYGRYYSKNGRYYGKYGHRYKAYYSGADSEDAKNQEPAQDSKKDNNTKKKFFFGK